MSTTEIINGSRTSYGPQETIKNAPYEAGDVVKHLVAQLLTVAGSADLLVEVAADETVIEIPANSFIYDSYLNVKVAFTATTAVSITAGSETDPDGLVTAAGIGAKANLLANTWQQADGVLHGASWGTSDESIVAAWNVADATAVGNGALVVMFIPPLLG